MPRLRFIIVIAIVVAAAFTVFFLGRRYAPPEKSSPGKVRIVSLAPNVTEILFALGLDENIVGVTDACDYPPEAKSIRRVSGFGTPNVESLLAIAPDIVISCGLEKPETLAVLRQSGIQVVDVQPGGSIASFSELFDAIRAIGDATGRAKEAAVLIERMQSELDAVAARVAKIEEAKRRRVFVEIEPEPLMTVGAGSFIDEMLTRAGGRNVAHEIKNAYPRIDPEKVIAWNPEVILVAHSNAPGEAAKRLAEHIGWSDVGAVRERRVIDDIDPDLLFRPGPRLADGVKQLAERLNPLVPTLRAGTH
jgi:iron complex transport system substrate-binding protein